MRNRIERARYCQQDIRHCEQGYPSRLLIDRYGAPYSIKGDGLRDLIEYRAFPMSQAAVREYEDILQRSHAKSVLDIGSGLGTSVLSACIVAEQAGQIERVYSIETSPRKRNWMRQYLEYSGTAQFVELIEEADTNEVLAMCRDEFVVVIDCWPAQAIRYAQVLARTESPCANTVVIDTSTAQDERSVDKILANLGVFPSDAHFTENLVVTHIPKHGAKASEQSRT